MPMDIAALALMVGKPMPGIKFQAACDGNV